MIGHRSTKRPYDVFVDDVYATLLAEVTTYAASIPGGLPAGFDVTDFVQHALLKLLEVYDRRGSEAAAYTYARKTAIHALLDAMRAATRRELPEWLAGVAATHGGTGRTPDETAEHLSRRQRVNDALDQLPDRQRQAVRLLYMEGFSRAEAAEIMGVTKTTVKSLAQRARVTLTAALKNAPGVAAVGLAVHAVMRHARRPAAVAAATAPRVAIALCLTVAEQPIVVPMPAVGAHEVTLSRDHPARPVAGPRVIRRPVRRTFRAASPPASDHPIAPSILSEAVVPGAPTAPSPKAGGCAGDKCVGDEKIGDELCVEDDRQEQTPVCANQDVVGVCPTANQLALPRTRCTRHSDPTFDP